MSDKISKYISTLLENMPNASRRHLLNSQPIPGGKIRRDGNEFIDFASNDYLGLAHHPKLRERSVEWMTRYGNGSGASRLVSGTSEQVTELEHKIAKIKGSETALIMNSGYQANASVLSTLLSMKSVNGQEPLLFTDKLNHASLHSGARMAGIRQIRYRHNDLTHLEELLEKHSAKTCPSFIVTESVFSMDGDILDVKGITALAKSYDAFLYIDEAHATGVLGEHGYGLCKGSEVDLIMGTCGKALGSYGAYIACDQHVKEYLINHCSGLIYATALPPAILGSIDAAFDLLPELSEDRARLIRHGDRLRQALHDLNFETLNSSTQIIPIIIGADEKVLQAGQIIQESGIICGIIRPPTVPKKTARLRICLSASHNEGQVSRLIEALERVAREINI